MNPGIISMHTGSLDAIIQSTVHLKSVFKKSVRPGDCIIVRTRNSTYALKAQEDGSYLVSGGWFDRMGSRPAKVHVNGCTWGGCVIKVDIVAACGLSIEFGNRVTTSPIQHITFIPIEEQN